MTDKNQNDQMPENPGAQEDIDEKEQQLIENSKLLKICFQKAIKVFNKNISEEVLFANESISENEKVNSYDIINLAKKVGLNAEVRRINILDIKSGPAIVILSDSRSYLIIDEKTGFNPETGEEEEIDLKSLEASYIGYSIFFYEENLTLSSFVQKTSFLFKSVKQFRPTFIEMVVISFFINLFAVVSPLYTMNIYDRVIPNFAVSTLFVLSLGMFLVYIFDFVFKVIKSYLSDYISLSIGNEVDQVLLNKLMLAKNNSVNLSSGAKNSLFKELSMVREFYFSRFIPSLIDLPFVVLFLAVLFLISPLIALVPFIAAMVVFVVNILLQVPLQNTHAKMIGSDQQRNSVLVETISGIESIKIFNAVGKTMHKWRRSLDRSYNQSYGHNLWVNVATNFSMFVMHIVVVTVMIVGVFEITAGVMTTGGLIASSTLASRVMTNVIGFSGMIVRYRSIQNTLRHLEKIVNSPMEDDDTFLESKGPFKGKITFKDVNFFYPGMKAPILNKCSFNIEAKNKVAIIGKTGAGKSTVTRLLLGMDFANGGQIFIDDYSINNIHINELRDNIGFMPQKSFFFSGTIRENILMGAGSNVTEEQYKRACELAGVPLITSLSAKGDDMMIQEGGVNLSGGQQQIVAMARAIVKDPPIIIMDEPTNGMDTSLEQIFMNNVKEYIKDKTFILITHRPSQLNLVDRVILIDNSTVVIDDTKDKVLEVLSKGKKGN